jgi:hypothetical protein
MKVSPLGSKTSLIGRPSISDSMLFVAQAAWLVTVDVEVTVVVDVTFTEVVSLSVAVTITVEEAAVVEVTSLGI